MTNPTHCLPSGSLGSFQVPVPPVNLTNTVVNNPSSGLRRGRCILLPGLGGSTAAVPPWEYGGDGNAMRVALNADGWQTIECGNVPQNGFSTAQQQATGASYGGVQAIYPTPGGIPTAVPGFLADILNDSGNGARMLQSELHHFDHVYEWAADNYGTMPVIVIGESNGGWLACQVAINRGPGPYAVKAAYSANTPNDFSKINPGAGTIPLISGPSQLGSAAFAGMNLGTHSLNGVTIPLRVTWGYLDNIITGGNGSWSPPQDCMNMVASAGVATGGTVQSGSATVAAGQTAVDTNGAAWLAGAGTLTLSGSMTGFSSSGGVAVISQATGNVITIAFSYTGYSGNTLQGCCSNPMPPGQTTLLQTGSTVETVVASGGLVTGAGRVSDHGWDATATSDALAWLYATVDPNFPKVY